MKKHQRWDPADTSVEPWLPERSWHFSNDDRVRIGPAVKTDNLGGWRAVEWEARYATADELLVLRLEGAIKPCDEE